MSIGLTIDEFKVSVVWGLFGLFFQLPHFMFAIIYFDKCKKSLSRMALGLLLIILGLAGTAH